MRYLIGYLSKTGTTREIAERVGARLRTAGAEVEVSPLAEVKSLESYDRLVFGCPVNGMKTLPEFKEFLSGSAASSGKPVDLFIVSYLFEAGRATWRRAILKDVEACRSLVGAGQAEIFGGRIATPLPGFVRLLFGTPKDLPLDLRNWETIDSWAGNLTARD